MTAKLTALCATILAAAYVALAPPALPPRPPGDPAPLHIADVVVESRPVYQKGDAVRVHAPDHLNGRGGVVVLPNGGGPNVHLVEVAGVGHLIADNDLTPIPEAK